LTCSKELATPVINKVAVCTGVAGAAGVAAAEGLAEGEPPGDGEPLAAGDGDGGGGAAAPGEGTGSVWVIWTILTPGGIRSARSRQIADQGLI